MRQIQSAGRLKLRAALLLLIALAVQACATGPTPQSPTLPDGTLPSAAAAARNFEEVVDRVTPVAEQECRKRSISANCNFRIAVDTRPGEPPNAFQTVDKQGRPVVTFTIALIASVRNADELAFIMGHEAAHHVAGHLELQHRAALKGAEALGAYAEKQGASARQVAEAQRIGAELGARQYSKQFELEADQIGAIITYRAGYDPVAGAQFFARIPDPGDKFLGTHPPNASRVQVVRDTVAGLSS